MAALGGMKPLKGALEAFCKAPIGAWNDRPNWEKLDKSKNCVFRKCCVFPMFGKLSNSLKICCIFKCGFRKSVAFSVVAVRAFLKGKNGLQGALAVKWQFKAILRQTLLEGL